MTKISDTLVSTNFRAIKEPSVTCPWLGRDEIFCTRLDNFQGDLDDLQMGVVVADSISQLIALELDVAAGDDPNLIFNENAPFKFEVVDVIVQARATVGGGTMKVTDGTSDITDAIVCATNGNKTCAGTINDAKATIAAGGSLKCVGSAAGVKGLVTILIVPRS